MFNVQPEPLHLLFLDSKSTRTFNLDSRMTSTRKQLDKSAEDFPALPGFYKLLFLYLEPISTLVPIIFIWMTHGSAWFHNELIPPTSNEVVLQSLGPRTKLAIWQLSNCYLILSMMASILYRSLRNSLRDQPAIQERILGAALFVLAFADVTHIAATLFGFPPEVRWNFFAAWNSMAHGNVTAVVVLFIVRVAWFLGIGRTAYYYGLTPVSHLEKTKKKL